MLVFGGSLGARSINHAAVAAFADAPYRVLHVAGRRDFPDLDARPARTTTCATTSRPFGLRARGRRPRRRPRRRLDLRARAVRRSRPCWSRTRTPPATTRRPTRAGWSEGGAAIVLADAELTPERLRAAVDAILLDAARLRPMAAASRALARPDAAATSRARCSSRGPIVHSLTRDSSIRGVAAVHDSEDMIGSRPRFADQAASRSSSCSSSS